MALSFADELLAKAQQGGQLNLEGVAAYMAAQKQAQALKAEQDAKKAELERQNVEELRAYGVTTELLNSQLMQYYQKPNPTVSEQEAPMPSNDPLSVKQSVQKGVDQGVQQAVEEKNKQLSEKKTQDSIKYRDDLRSTIAGLDDDRQKRIITSAYHSLIQRGVSEAEAENYVGELFGKVPEDVRSYKIDNRESVNLLVAKAKAEAETMGLNPLESRDYVNNQIGYSNAKIEQKELEENPLYFSINEAASEFTKGETSRLHSAQDQELNQFYWENLADEKDPSKAEDAMGRYAFEHDIPSATLTGNARYKKILDDVNFRQSVAVSSMRPRTTNNTTIIVGGLSEHDKSIAIDDINKRGGLYWSQAIRSALGKSGANTVNIENAAKVVGKPIEKDQAISSADLENILLDYANKYYEPRRGGKIEPANPMSYKPKQGVAPPIPLDELTPDIYDAIETSNALWEGAGSGETESPESNTPDIEDEDPLGD